MGPALFSLLHATSLTKACKLADATWMKQGSTVPTAHRNRDGRNCSLLDHLIDKSLSDPRVAVFLQLPTAARTSALATILDSDEGKNFREEASQWLVEALSVRYLVPERYAEWRPVVREAMLYFGSHLSTPRLAPKLVEQIELPADTTPEKRLLRLIAKVPGLQKLGQVIARNRHLHPRLRRALTQLENGICDVTVEETPGHHRAELRSDAKAVQG